VLLRRQILPRHHREAEEEMILKRIFLIMAAISMLGAQDDPQYTSDGLMRLPANYREWVFLSSGLAMTYGPAGQTNAQGNPRFDNVFVSPAAYKSFLKTGTWPDKTTMVLEIRDSDSHVSINTGGRVQTGLAAVEVHVKDSARFKGGWAFFGFDKSDKAKLIPTSASCYSCHEQHGAVDTTFVQFYPTLIDVAKEKGTLKP
jgi:Cytochrome P460